MKNAAALLADLLEEWDVPQGQSASTQRQKVAQAKSTTFWSMHKLAVGYLLQLERDLDALEAAGDQVSFYRETVSSWYAGVFAYATGWQGGVSSKTPVLDRLELRLLRALAGQIDAMRLSPRLAASQLADISDALNEAWELIDGAEEGVISEAAKRYLLGLIFEASKVIEEIDTFGTAALRSLTFELGGGMGSVAELATDPETKKTWWAKTTRVLAQWGATVPVAAIESGVDAAVQGVIEG